MDGSTRGLSYRPTKIMAVAGTICFLLWTVYFSAVTAHTLAGFGFLNNIATEGDYKVAATMIDEQMFPADLAVIWIQNTLVCTLCTLSSLSQLKM